MTGDEARALRRGLKMSARQVGEEVGTTESSIYRWELRGTRSVPKMYEFALRWLLHQKASWRTEQRRDNGGGASAGS